eukprot:1981616-Rhodomonas_salina.1
MLLRQEEALHLPNGTHARLGPQLHQQLRGVIALSNRHCLPEPHELCGEQERGTLACSSPLRPVEHRTICYLSSGHCTQVRRGIAISTCRALLVEVIHFPAMLVGS